MDKGHTLKVTKVYPTITLSMNSKHYKYQRVLIKHKCGKSEAFNLGDIVVVQNVAANKDVLVSTPCGCDHMLYDLILETSN